MEDSAGLKDAKSIKLTNSGLYITSRRVRVVFVPSPWGLCMAWLRYQVTCRVVSSLCIIVQEIKLKHSSPVLSHSFPLFSGLLLGLSSQQLFTSSYADNLASTTLWWEKGPFWNQKGRFTSPFVSPSLFFNSTTVRTPSLCLSGSLHNYLTIPAYEHTNFCHSTPSEGCWILLDIFH